jgi:predicted phosphodiesterase
MMRYALISDIHGNQPALEAVLADIARRPALAATYHLGDLVGYGPFPNEVIAALQREAIPGVAGNYDSTAATDYPHCGCRYEDPHQEALAHLSYQWTRAHLSPESKRFLGGLPFRIDLRPLGGHVAGPVITLLHGNQLLNTVYVHQDRPDEFLANMGNRLAAKPGDLVCFGHTHKPWHRIVQGIHYVNTGSVGKPKDADWRACYVLLAVDGQGVEVEFVRVGYDLEAIVSAIRASELPDDFAEQLRTGGKPTAVIRG